MDLIISMFISRGLRQTGVQATLNWKQSTLAFNYDQISYSSDTQSLWILIDIGKKLWIAAMFLQIIYGFKGYNFQNEIHL